MNVVPVSQLCRQKESTSSDILLAELVGRVEIARQEIESDPDAATPRFRQGTVLLYDLQTTDVVPVRFDYWHHELDGAVVTLKVWKYIQYDDSVSLIEVLIDYVYRLGVTDQNFMQEVWNSSQVIVRMLLQQRIKQDLNLVPLSKLNGSSSKTVTIAGRICSRPVLYSKGNLASRFFVEVTDEKKSWSTTIMFDGTNTRDDPVRHYHTLRVGSLYLFSHLTTTQIVHADSADERRRVLKFEKHSQCHCITEEQYQSLLQSAMEEEDACENMITEEDENMDQSLPLALPRQVCPDIVEHYTGIVTRVISSIFGIYELDRRILLSLFHYSQYQLERPFRPGTRLRIYGAHMVAISSDHGQSALLSSHCWNAPMVVVEGEEDNNSAYVALVPCMRSMAEVIDFPDHCYVEYGDTWLTRYGFPEGLVEWAIFRDVVQARSDFSTLLRRLELLTALAEKFAIKTYKERQREEDDERYSARLLVKSARKLVQSVFEMTKNKVVRPFGDLFHDFFRHTKSCSAIGKSFAAGPQVVSLDSCPRLDQVFEFMTKAGQQRSTDYEERSLAAATGFMEHMSIDVSGTDYKVGNAKQKQPFWVVGVVDGSADGQLQFRDDTYALPLLLQGEEPGRTLDAFEMGNVYLVKQFKLVCEDLSYIEESGSKADVKCYYMVCDCRDIEVILRIAAPKRTLCISESPRNWNPKQVLGFTCENNTDDLEDLNVLHVISKHPVSIRQRSHGACSLQTYIRAVRYPVLPFDDDDSKSNEEKPRQPSEIYLLLNTAEDTLKYNAQLQVGCWIGLSGDLDNDSIQLRVDASKYLPKRTKLPGDMTPTIVLKNEVHELLPLHEKAISKSLRLRPKLVDEDSSSPLSALHIPRVYTVSDLYAPPDSGRAPGLVEVGERILEDLVDLQGIIISKGFRDPREVEPTIRKQPKLLFEKYVVGTGHPNRRLWFRVRQADGLETVDVYFDVSGQQYPLGAIPGSLVTFRRLLRKRTGNKTDAQSAASFYCQGLANTTIAAHLKLEPTTAEVIVTNHLPTLMLHSLVLNHQKKKSDEQQQTDNSTGPLYRSVCSVEEILNLEFYWECVDCGAVVSNNVCYGFCAAARRVFIAKAVVMVSDGTADVQAMIDGERLVGKLLTLQTKQMDILKTNVLKSGMLTFGSWTDFNTIKPKTTESSASEDEEDEEGKENQPKKEALRGMTISDICRRIQKGQRYMIYGKTYIQKSSNNRNINNNNRTGGGQESSSEDIMRELGLTRLRTTQTERDPVETVTRRRLRVKVVELELLDKVQAAWNLVELAENSSSNVSNT